MNRMVTKKLFLFVITATLTFSSISCKKDNKEVVKMDEVKNITINEEKTLQEIEGFGASGAWWAQDVGGWTEDKRKEVTALLFDKDKGIGLSMFRYNIGAGSGMEISDPWRRTETFETAKGQYDFTKDANSIKILKDAKEMGVKDFVAFSNSPTARMTVSGKVSGEANGQSNLRKDMYEDYAQYLIDVTKHLVEEEHIPVKWISPINEPQWDWKSEKGQEGCHYTPQECADFSEVFIKKLKDNKLDVKASLIDSGEWKESHLLLDELMKKSEVKKDMDTYAIHSYWSDNLDKMLVKDKIKTQYPDLKLWQSEWTEMKSGRDTGMDSALVMAQVIQEDLCIGEVTSWQYWIAVSKYDYRDGLIYTDAGKQNVIETKRLWVLGNYSKFIKPGFKRIEAACQGSPLKLVAFKEPETGKIVVVVTNLSNESEELSFKSISNHKNMNIYETSEKNNLKNIFSGGKKDVVKFEPHSVTTVVLK